MNIQITEEISITESSTLLKTIMDEFEKQKLAIEKLQTSCTARECSIHVIIKGYLKIQIIGELQTHGDKLDH